MKKTTLPLIAISLALSACQTMKKVDPIHGISNPTPEAAAKAKVKYYGSIIELRPEKEKEYRELHAVFRRQHSALFTVCLRQN